jgi:hypothetical protein
MVEADFGRIFNHKNRLVVRNGSCESSRKSCLSRTDFAYDQECAADSDESSQVVKDRSRSQPYSHEIIERN